MLFTKMQDTLVLVYKALKADDVVKEKIKGIYNNPRAPDSARDTFPRLTMFEMLNRNTEYADDKALMNTVDIRIDIWSRKNNLFELSAAVKECIEGAFTMCSVELVSDMYEDDTNIYHKPINVKIMMNKTEVENDEN